MIGSHMSWYVRNYVSFGREVLLEDFECNFVFPIGSSMPTASDYFQALYCNSLENSATRHHR